MDPLLGHAQLLGEMTSGPTPGEEGLRQGIRELRQRTFLETLERHRPGTLVLSHFGAKVGCLRRQGCNVQFVPPPVGAGDATLSFQVCDGFLDTVQVRMGRLLLHINGIISIASWLLWYGCGNCGRTVQVGAEMPGSVSRRSCVTVHSDADP